MLRDTQSDLLLVCKVRNIPSAAPIVERGTWVVTLPVVLSVVYHAFALPGVSTRTPRLYPSTSPVPRPRPVFGSSGREGNVEGEGEKESQRGRQRSKLDR